MHSMQTLPGSQQVRWTPCYCCCCFPKLNAPALLAASLASMLHAVALSIVTGL
jgi:hypothetical protein